MEPADQPSDPMAGPACAACGLPVPPDRVRVLATRDDLTFAELPCAGCGSTGLAIYLSDRDTERGEMAASTAHPENSPSDGPPVSADDVLDMHLYLAGWTGDARELVARPSRGPGPGA